MVSFVIFDLSLSAINTNNCDDLRWSYKDISLYRISVGTGAEYY